MYVSNCWGGGLEIHLYLLSLELLRRGARVTLAVHPWFARDPERRSALLAAGAEFVLLPLVSAPRSAAALARLASLFWRLRQRRFDIVIAHGNGATNYHLRRFVKTSGKFVWHDHFFGAQCKAVGDVFEDPVLLAFAEPLQKTARLADLVVISSRAGAHNLRTLQGRRGQIVIAPALSKVGAPDASERTFNRQSILRFGLFGSLERRKGVPQLLNLWPSIDVSPSELHFFGNDPDAQFEAQARRLGLKKVFFHGAFHPDELPRLMELTDVGLVLSTIEGYPCVAWELMAFGVPFVITPTGAALECTANNPDTELASFSPEGVRNAIERLAERVRAGQTSRIRLQRLQRNEFSYEAALTKHLSYCLPEAKVNAA